MPNPTILPGDGGALPPAEGPYGAMASAWVNSILHPTDGFGATWTAPAPVGAQALNNHSNIDRIIALIGSQYIPGKNITEDALKQMLQRAAIDDGMSDAQVGAYLASKGLAVQEQNSGKWTFSSRASGGQGAIQAPEAYRYGNDTKPPPGVMGGGTGGVSGPFASGGGGGGGGGAAGNPYQGLPGWGGGGGGSPGAGGAGIYSGFTGAGGGIDFSKPIGLKIPGGLNNPGIGTTSGGPFAGYYGRPSSIFAGLPANPTYGDVVGQITKRQEENRNAALGVLGNARGEIMNDPTRASMTSLTQAMLADPHSINDATLNNMIGRQNDAIGQRAARASQAAADRNAALGLTRSGVADSQQQAIDTNAANAMSSGERDLRIQQALQNKQDERNALGAALPVVSEGTQARNNLDLSAVRDVLGTTSIYGDAFLSNLLLGGQGQGQNVNPYTKISPNVPGISGPFGAAA